MLLKKEGHMGFWRFLKRKRPGETDFSAKNIISFDIRCGKCGEKIKVMVNKNTDLQDQYLDEGETGVAYTLRKEAMDDKCFSLMTITAEFNKNKDLLNKDIAGGEFI
jgi:hypothetical protein